MYPTPCTGAHRNVTPYNHDKQNKVDFSWFIVRTLPHQERKLADMLAAYQAKAKNILEVYCPTHTTVSVSDGGKQEDKPLFAGYVFVHSTQEALTEFIDSHYPEGIVMYGRRLDGEQRAALWTIPEDQMRAFKDFNENYAEMVVVLERPYADYAFNPHEDNQANEIVRVLDGPLAGCEGYVCRLNRKKGLVFRVQGMMPGSYLTVSYPNICDLHVVRLHNAEGDRLSIGTEKARGADCIIGLLQACGCGERTLPMLYDIMDCLAVKPSLVSLCKDLYKKGEKALSMRLAQISGKEAELVLNLARYERDNPGFVKRGWSNLTLRPFLTPTSGLEMAEGQDEARLPHQDFIEIIRKVDITEEVYYPTQEKGGTATTTYYAHVGMRKDAGKDGYVLFANWDEFLGEYFLTAGKANEKLVGGTVPSVESFRNYAPTLYHVLASPDSAVKAERGFQVGEDSLNVMTVASSEPEQGAETLVRTCVNICKEINTTNRLAIWRRYLRAVWLHQ